FEARRAKPEWRRYYRSGRCCEIEDDLSNKWRIRDSGLIKWRLRVQSHRRDLDFHRHNRDRSKQQCLYQEQSECPGRETGWHYPDDREHLATAHADRWNIQSEFACGAARRSEEHTSELQSRSDLVC